MMGSLNYLTALDYVTASRLHPQETALTVRCLVPWNYRGLLFTVLLEQGRVMLEGTGEHESKSSTSGDSQQENQLQAPTKRENHRSGTPAGVQSLAVLLMELQPSADGSQILAADALYQLGRVEEAYRLLLSVGPISPRAPILARLALLQLHRGFLYDTNQECTQDILVALQINTDIVTKDILSLKDKARKLVCDWLHQFCRANLSDILIVNAVPCHEEHLREAFIIGGALMRTDCRDPRWHLLYVDILLAKGEVKAAGAHLCQVFGQEPRDAVAQARVGVVEAWQQNYRSAARRLSKLTEKDSSSLDFLLALIPFNQRKRMAQWDQAVTLLTVAVQAVGNHRLQYLRQRAACLAQLGLHERAIADLDRVIQRHGGSDSSCSDDPQVWVEDLCRRGRSLVLCSREGAALEDFTQALELHKNRAIQCVEAGLGRLRVAECFLRGALQHYGEQQLNKAWTLIECGLVVDSENTELRRLRARVKREVASPCNVN
ncbi:Tetratricopeptide repeat protein 34 [Nibea albiflora]|uniref:Tetratricopeptide repeat protein 34 n=1 Tax=Nibea albiflora TaxID=240163 RepID=A0ACB7EPI5_NIBAL|nr:Tetratricopeptide repeat protein 34 [Nibea albiflora]